MAEFYLKRELPSIQILLENKKKKKKGYRDGRSLAFFTLSSVKRES